MNVEYLRSFIVAADEGSLNKAAKAQFLSVPSFAQRINSLESELGFRVLERDRQGVRPTEAGHVLYRAAIEALGVLDGAVARGRDIAAAGSNLRVVIGVWWQVPLFLAEAVRTFTEERPDVQVDFVEVDFEEACEGFSRGDLDLFLSRDSYVLGKLGAEFVLLDKERYFCLCSPDSPLVRCATVTVDMLKDITVYAGSDYRDIPELGAFEAFFARDNVVKTSIFKEKLFMECLQGRAVSFFNEVNLPRVCPPLEARPLEWPKLAYGIHVRPGTGEEVNALVATCVDSFNRMAS